MKQYINKVILFVSLFGLILIMLISIQYIRINNYSWKLPNNEHILFMGASHIARGIDDTLMKEAINLARPSERYMYTYIKLQHILKNNTQVDTIFLQCAHTDLAVDCDYKYFDENELSGYVGLYWPFFSYQHYKLLVPKFKVVISYILKSLVNKNSYNHDNWFNDFGGYEPLEGTMNTENITPNPESDRGCGHVINYTYLKQIIKLCKEHNIKLFLVQCPVFHPEYFFDVSYHEKTLEEFTQTVEYIDFSEWKISNDEFLDPHHLNRIGAERFTMEIRSKFNID